MIQEHILKVMPLRQLCSKCRREDSLTADSNYGYWSNLANSGDLCSTAPLQRWNVDSYYSPEAGYHAGGIYARLGCHLSNIDKFDNQFFNLPKSEALLLDPHARLLLEATQARAPTL